jgi:hypothetical protein
VVTVPGYRSRDPGVDFRLYQIFWEVVGLERGQLSLVRITEKLLEWKSSGSGARKIEINGRENPLRWPRGTLYLQKMALASPKFGGRSFGIVRLRTKATKFSLVNNNNNNNVKAVEAKALLVTCRGSPQRCETSRLPHFLNNRLTDVGKVVSLTSRPSFNPQEDFWYSLLLEGESTTGPQCNWKD